MEHDYFFLQKWYGQAVVDIGIHIILFMDPGQIISSILNLILRQIMSRIFGVVLAQLFIKEHPIRTILSK